MNISPAKSNFRLQKIKRNIIVIQSMISEIKNSLAMQINNGQTHIYLSAPHSLYISDKQAQLFETATQQNTVYQDELDEPILNLLSSNVAEIFSSIESHINFIDLGPGHPSKSLGLLDYMSENGTNPTYYAVDISEFFLDHAVNATRERNIASYRIHRRFEDLEATLDADIVVPSQRIIFMGLTFNNFDLSEIIKILKGIMKKGDLCLICTQNKLLEQELVAPYLGENVKVFTFATLELLGFSALDVDYVPSFYDGAVHTDFITNKEIMIDDIKIPKNTRITTAKSFRYETDFLHKHLEHIFIIPHVYHNKQISLFVIEGK